MKKDMRKLTYLLTIILGLLSACNSKNNSTSRLLPEPDIIERLKYEKTEIDTLFKKGKGECLTFIKLTETSQPVLLETDTLTEEVITTYYILKDSLSLVKILETNRFDKDCFLFTSYRLQKFIYKHSGTGCD